MPTSIGKYSPPKWGVTRWLVATGTRLPAEIEQALVASLFGVLSIFLGGVVNTVLVAALITWHMQRPEFYAWLALEVLICAARYLVLTHCRRAALAGRLTPTDLHILLSLAWAASVGLGAFLTITSGDWLAAALACLSATAMTGGICFRSFGAPRLSTAMMCLSLAPGCLGSLLVREPLFMLTLIQLPVYVLSMTKASFRMNAMLVTSMQAERESAHRARHDPLTGLLNRASLVDAIELAGAAPGTRIVTLFYLDLDGFKPVNDVYGHGRGDALLRQVADRLRLAAAAESAHVSRIGGDEFAVLLEGESQVFAQDFAQRLLNSVSAPYLLPRSEDHTGEVRGDRRGDYRVDRGVDGIEVCVGVSIGVAHADPRKRNAEAILNLADDALYIAKSRGKSRFHIAEHDVPANPDTAPLAASAA